MHPPYFNGGEEEGQGADHEATYNLYLIFKNCVVKIM